jgi:radical SAM superfamily enzyme YgiQ (UPF0313 family)
MSLVKTLNRTKKIFTYYAISFVTRHLWILKILLPLRERLMNLFYKDRRKPSLSRFESQLYSDMDIVLVQAPAWGVCKPPFATASLTAYLRKHGFQVMPMDINIELYQKNKDKYSETWCINISNFWTNPSMVDGFINENHDIMERYVEYIIKSNAKIVGFTVYSSSYFMSSYLAKRIKERDSSILIIYGGPEVARTMSGLKIISNDKNVDCMVEGEGEETILEIVRRVKSGAKIEGCRGTLCWTGSEIIDGGERELIIDLDSLPFPDFSDFDFSMYREPFQIPIASSRGCINRCIYCDERVFWKRFRSRSGESLFLEIKHQIEKHPHVFFFEFQDSLVNGNIKELGKLCDAIIENKVRIKWSAQAVIRKEMTYDFLVKLRKSGCVSLTYGLESASSALMTRVGKNFARNADVERIIRDSYRAGICSNLNFMFGLPGETEEEFNETLEFLRRNKKHITTVNPSPYFCIFSKGTKGYLNPQDYGIDLKKGPLYWESVDGKNNYLVRMERFEKFIALAHKLGISCTYPQATMVNKNENIADYYYSTGEFDRAIPYFENSLKYESDNKTNQQKLKLCYMKGGKTYGA